MSVNVSSNGGIGLSSSFVGAIESVDSTRATNGLYGHRSGGAGGYINDRDIPISTIRTTHLGRVRDEMSILQDELDATCKT